MTGYLVPAQSIDVEEVIKNSQFITRIKPVSSVDEAKAFIRHLNQTYADATHHCWAYIVGNPSSTTLMGCSDDGEPSGTAGKPMLTVLQYSGIGDIIAVCTRYYGGTKLGTGGLTRAYGGGVKLALEALSVTQKVNYQTLSFLIDYGQLKDCEHLLKQYQIENLQQQFDTQIGISFDIASEEVTQFKTTIKNKLKGQITWNTT
ncbi:YigZ family protein [Aliikangiella maris]|uniref:YigZ family protein n=2 Tax=Aliikangiella maris TaxID=3162458 RepID=A0ABV2BVS2_9GAMM